jgi:hypothetical protein
MERADDSVQVQPIVDPNRCPKIASAYQSEESGADLPLCIQN